MATLTVGGVTVPVSTQTPPTRETVEYGDFTEAFDGTDRGTIVARKRVWTVTTALMTQAAADTLEAAILGTPPVTANGDLYGNVATGVHGTITGYRTVQVRTGFQISITFTLRTV